MHRLVAPSLLRVSQCSALPPARAMPYRVAELFRASTCLSSGSKAADDQSLPRLIITERCAQVQKSHN